MLVAAGFVRRVGRRRPKLQQTTITMFSFKAFMQMKHLLWPVCVWARSSWHSLGSRTPWRSQLFCHRQTEFWSQTRTQRQGLSCTFLQVSPWFQSWGLWPCRDAGHRRPTRIKTSYGMRFRSYSHINTFIVVKSLPFASSEAAGLS